MSSGRYDSLSSIPGKSRVSLSADLEPRKRISSGPSSPSRIGRQAASVISPGTMLSFQRVVYLTARSDASVITSRAQSPGRLSVPEEELFF